MRLVLCSQRVSLELQSPLSGIRGNPLANQNQGFHKLIHLPNKQVRACSMPQHTWMCCQVCLNLNLNLKKGEREKKKVQSFVSTSLNKCVLWLRWKGDNSQHVWQVFSVWVFICTWLHAGVITPWFLPSTRSLSITVSVRSACILPIPSSAESSKKNKQTKKKIVHPQNLCRLYMLCQAVHSLKKNKQKKKNWLYALEPQVQGLKANISKIFPQQSLRRLH